jgi:hypothetical protein
MSEVRLVPRFVLILAAALLISACAARPAPAPLRGNPCAGGAVPAENRQAPIVCIDDSGRKLRAYPDPVFVHDVKESDRITPVEIQWFTTSGLGDVEVQLEDGCVTEKQCDRHGKCSAKTIRGANKRCKYDVWIEGDKEHEKLDPVVVITTCC